MIGAAVGWLLIAAGILIFLIAAVIMFFEAIKRRTERFRGGGLVMLGPIPIIFGTDKETVKVLVILSIALIAIMLTFFIVMVLLRVAGLGGL